jgi:hypothetical protein
MALGALANPLVGSIDNPGQLAANTVTFVNQASGMVAARFAQSHTTGTYRR